MVEFSASCKVSQRILKYVLMTTKKTQRAVAVILGVHFTYVSKVFHGQRSFTLEHIERLSAGIGLKMPLLMWRALKPTGTSGKRKKALDEIDLLFKEVYPEEFETP